MYLTASVGQGGVNNVGDVKFVQELINLIAGVDIRIPIVVVDGRCGKNTYGAIRKYQQYIVKLANPDGRIDPNGRSEKTLVAKALEIDKDHLADIAKKYNLKKASPAVHQKGPKVITYRANAKKLLSGYTENVIKLAMSYAGINKCDISSTIRTFDDQSRIMYNNCASYPKATSVESLKSARGWGYAAQGREIEQVYFDKKSSGQDSTIKAMKAKIEELYKNGKQVSLHCVSEEGFRKKNVLDIPYSSVPANKRKDFEVALMGMALEIKNLRYKKPIAGEIYISKLIIEDKCWHLEISQTNKPIPNQNIVVAQAAALRTTPRLGVTKAKISSSPNAFDSCIAFLDYWF